MTANTPASRKAKGRRFQQAVRQDLIDHLGVPEGDVLSTAMGQSGCDLYLSPAARERFPFGVECKAQEAIALPAWWRQCTRNAEAEGLAPLLVLKQSRREPLAVLRWEDLLALLQNIPANLPGGSRRRRGTTLTCPQCGYPQYCGRITCLKKVPEGYLRYHWTEDGENITCANCGLTMHADLWLDDEERQIRRPRS